MDRGEYVVIYDAVLFLSFVLFLSIKQTKKSYMTFDKLGCGCGLLS